MDGTMLIALGVANLVVIGLIFYELSWLKKQVKKHSEQIKLMAFAGSIGAKENLLLAEKVEELENRMNGPQEQDSGLDKQELLIESAETTTSSMTAKVEESV